jgi:hypothetical protein
MQCPINENFFNSCISTAATYEDNYVEDAEAPKYDSS